MKSHEETHGRPKVPQPPRGADDVWRRPGGALGKLMGSMLLLSAVLVAAAVAACLLWGAPLGHAVININGDTLDLAQWQGSGVLAGIGGLAIGALVLLVVVPFAVILPLLFVGVLLALLLAVLGATLAGVAALVFSPLFLLVGLVWLIWRLVRRSEKRVDTMAP